VRGEVKTRGDPFELWEPKREDQLQTSPTGFFVRVVDLKLRGSQLEVSST